MRIHRIHILLLPLPVLWLVSPTYARDRVALWCPPHSTGSPPGCAALDAIDAANASGDYSISCLSIPLCAGGDTILCPTSGPLADALVRLRERSGSESFETLESVCWNTVETSWQQRVRAADAISDRLRPQDRAESLPLAETQLAAWTQAHAEEMRPRVRYLMRFENDSIGSLHTDSNYTMGLSISAIRDGWPADGSVQRPLLRGLNLLNRATGIDKEGIDATATTWWRLGSTDFTPKDIKASTPDRNDTPYASLVFFETGYSQQRGSVRLDSSLEVGVFGTNVGREVQTAIHKVCCQQNIPRGWEHQIGNGGSVTFLYHAQWSRPWLRDVTHTEWVYELRPMAGAEIGYRARAVAGALFTVAGSEADLSVPAGGILSPVEAPLPPRPSENGLPQDAASPTEGPGDRGSGVSLWLDYKLSAVAYDELLQGAWSGRSDVTYPWKELEPLVWQAGIGVELTFIERAINPWHPSGGRLFYTLEARSRQLKEGREGTHTWGGVFYSWGF